MLEYHQTIKGNINLLPIKEPLNPDNAAAVPESTQTANVDVKKEKSSNLIAALEALKSRCRCKKRSHKAQ